MMMKLTRSQIKSNCCRGLTIISDMDGCLTPTPTKSGGFTTRIDKSPTFDPICRFLQAGGQLIAATNAGTFPFRQLWEPLFPVLKEQHDSGNYKDPGQFCLSNFSGAAMYVSFPGLSDKMFEDENFTATARHKTFPNDPSTAMAAASSLLLSKEKNNPHNKSSSSGSSSGSGGVENRNNTNIRKKLASSSFSSSSSSRDDVAASEAVLEELMTIIRNVVLEAFRLMDEDPAYLPKLSRKYREALPAIVQLRRDFGKEKFESEIMTMENMREYGKFLEASNDPLIDFQTVTTGELVQINVLGTKMEYFDQLFTPALRERIMDLASVHVKRQPNSTTMSRDGVNKGLPVEYLCELAENKTCPKFSPERFVQHQLLEQFRNDNDNNNNNSDSSSFAFSLEDCSAEQREVLEIALKTEQEQQKGKPMMINYAKNFSLSRAVAIGDHLSFTDWPFTQYPPLETLNCGRVVTPESLTSGGLSGYPFKGRVHQLRGTPEEEGVAVFVDALVDQCEKRFEENGGKEVVWRPEFCGVAAAACGKWAPGVE